MTQKKNSSTIDNLIKACDTILKQEANATFWVETHFLKQDLEQAKKIKDKPNKIKIVGNINNLMDLSKEIQKEGLDCVTCNAVDFLLVDLAQDDLFAECFDEAIPREKAIRNTNERKYTAMDTNQFNKLNRKKLKNI